MKKKRKNKWKKKENIGKLKKKSNFEKKNILKKKEKKQKKKEKREKLTKKKEEKALWITVVIHSAFGVGKQWFPHNQYLWWYYNCELMLDKLIFYEGKKLCQWLRT